jgi:ABC-type bacteriocin/lantibiotic exporter with double-glycine peptidase domain
MEQDAFARWAGFHAKVLEARRNLERQTAGLRVVPPLLASLGHAGILGLGSILVMRGAMSVGDLVAFQALAARFAGPIGQLVAFGSAIPQIKADLGRIADVTAHPVDPRAAADESLPADTPSLPQGSIELRDVVFGYNPNEPPLIDGFSLSIRPGMRVALVGASGSGKSTIARLVCGIYRPWSGEVRIDGRRIEDIPPLTLANTLAYVEQDVVLFAGSVRDNVSMWNDGVDDPTLGRALRDAAIFDEIAARPGRHAHQVAEGGSNLSGGQRQRLEIARALAVDPAALILDEAMAALDPVVEAEVDGHLRRRGCTCILVAHRLSTIRDCDEIVMLGDGKVLGRGTHAELLASCPAYARLLDCE